MFIGNEKIKLFGDLAFAAFSQYSFSIEKPSGSQVIIRRLLGEFGLRIRGDSFMMASFHGNRF